MARITIHSGVVKTINQCAKCFILKYVNKYLNIIWLSSQNMS